MSGEGLALVFAGASVLISFVALIRGERVWRKVGRFDAKLKAYELEEVETRRIAAGRALIVVEADPPFSHSDYPRLRIRNDGGGDATNVDVQIERLGRETVDLLDRAHLPIERISAHGGERTLIVHLYLSQGPYRRVLVSYDDADGQRRSRDGHVDFRH